ncbi:uncharacterized protein FTOL_05811 [Fusarium torulosum]|uniref:Uncharacterized protein n=1 Tax=Fusarium torulosum TaxID=33205 RepID=A0AAE8SHF7_9HYPO|nr:uncharacterized protein FTOL_05811 [Fusarium torulosum]
MKSAYALTLCLSGMMGVDAWVLPGGAAPKSNYALQRPNDQAGNRNSAGTGIKFSPNQGSSAPKSGTVPGFIPVKGLAGGPSKRHSLYVRAAQPDDDGDDDAGDDEDAQMTAFSHPAFRIGTLKQADSGDDETKSFKVNNKKQNGKNKADDKKSKHSGDDDSTKTSEDNKTKTSSGASATKTTSKSSGSKHSGDDEKKVDDKKPKHSGGDDGTKTSKDHKTKTSSAASATKTPSKSNGSKHSGDDNKKTSKKAGDSKSSTKSKSKDAAHKSHTSKHS